jgi:recombination protein RecA
MAKKSSAPANNSLESVMDEINKNFGVGTIVRLDSDKVEQVDIIPTGVLPLDFALGTGGLPLGRIVEMYGPPSSGKSTLAMQTISEAQKQGLLCAYIDAEHALDPKYAKALGVNLNELLLTQPNHAEQGLEVMIRLAETGKVSVIVVDSVAALVPRAEIEGEMGQANIGLQARIMGQALRKVTGPAFDNNVLIIFINQLRESIGKMFGPTEYTPGGRGLGYYASVRLDIRRIQTIKKGETATANRTRVKVVKNKLAAPYREAEFDLVYGVGIPKENALIDCAIEVGVVKKSGAWITYQGEQLGQGRDKAIVKITENPNVYNAIYEEVMALANDPRFIAEVIEDVED